MFMDYIINMPILHTFNFINGIRKLLQVSSESHAVSESHESDAVSESDTVSESSNAAAAAELAQKYLPEYLALADRVLTDADFQQKMVCEPIAAGGDLIMTYDAETETFGYYTDHLKEVQYPLLEAVARKFVVTHHCKRLYKQLGLLLPPPIVEPTPQAVTERNLFAKFKKYNKGATTNFSTGLKVVEQTNHFRYKGKRYHYNEDVKKHTEKTKAPELDYATWKNLLASEI